MSAAAPMSAAAQAGSPNTSAAQNPDKQKTNMKLESLAKLIGFIVVGENEEARVFNLLLGKADHYYSQGDLISAGQSISSDITKVTDLKNKLNFFCDAQLELMDINDNTVFLNYLKKLAAKIQTATAPAGALNTSAAQNPIDTATDNKTESVVKTATESAKDKLKREYKEIVKKVESCLSQMDLEGARKAFFEGIKPIPQAIKWTEHPYTKEDLQLPDIKSFRCIVRDLGYHLKVYRKDESSDED